MHTKVNSLQLKTAVIGLGRIGFLNDVSNLNNSDIPLSHTKAVMSNDSLELVVGVDQNKLNRDLFTSSTQVDSVELVDQIHEKIDLAIISVPTKLHHKIFKATLERLEPRYVILEKPAGMNTSETIEMFDAASSAGVNILTPYFRIHAKEIVELRESLSQGKKGKVEEVIVTYSHGLRQNGCHFLHLVDYLVGALDFRIDAAFKNLENPSWVSHTINGLKLTFIGLDKSRVRSGDIKISCENGTYTLMNGGRIILSRELNVDTGWDEIEVSSKRIESIGIHNFYEDILFKFENRTLIDDESARTVRVQSLMCAIERELTT